MATVIMQNPKADKMRHHFVIHPAIAQIDNGLPELLCKNSQTPTRLRDIILTNPIVQLDEEDFR